MSFESSPSAGSSSHSQKEKREISSYDAPRSIAAFTFGDARRDQEAERKEPLVGADRLEPVLSKPVVDARGRRFVTVNTDYNHESQYDAEALSAFQSEVQDLIKFCEERGVLTVFLKCSGNGFSREFTTRLNDLRRHGIEYFEVAGSAKSPLPPLDAAIENSMIEPLVPDPRSGFLKFWQRTAIYGAEIIFLEFLEDLSRIESSESLRQSFKKDLQDVLPLLPPGGLIIRLRPCDRWPALAELVSQLEKFDRESVIFISSDDGLDRGESVNMGKLHTSHIRAVKDLQSKLALPRIAAPIGGWRYLRAPRYSSSDERFTVPGFQESRFDESELIKDLNALASDPSRKICIMTGSAELSPDFFNSLALVLQNAVDQGGGCLALQSSNESSLKVASLFGLAAASTSAEIDRIFDHYFPIGKPLRSGWSVLSKPIRHEKKINVLTTTLNAKAWAEDTLKGYINILEEIETICASRAHSLIIDITALPFNLADYDFLASCGDDVRDAGKSLALVAENPQNFQRLRAISKDSAATAHSCAESAFLELYFGVEPPRNGWQLFNLKYNQEWGIIDLSIPTGLVGRNFLVGNPSAEFHIEIEVLAHNHFDVILDLTPHAAHRLELISELNWAQRKFENARASLVLTCREQDYVYLKTTFAGSLYTTREAALRDRRNWI